MSGGIVWMRATSAAERRIVPGAGELRARERRSLVDSRHRFAVALQAVLVVERLAAHGLFLGKGAIQNGGCCG